MIFLGLPKSQHRRLPPPMATPINSIAATFSAVTTTKSSLNISPSASLSWNPHSSLSFSHKSSLLDLYGSPPPLPLRPITAVHSPRHRLNHSLRSISDLIPASVGAKIPNCVPLSYLDRNGVVRSVSLGGILKGKRRAVVVGVSAAFSPTCERFVRRVESADAFKAADIVACVAANDAFVMGAWGEHLAVDGDKWKMLSDGGGELWKELGILSTKSFWLSASNGIVTHVSLDGDCDSDVGDDLDRVKSD